MKYAHVYNKLARRIAESVELEEAWKEYKNLLNRVFGE
jgi:hypothetical protein